MTISPRQWRRELLALLTVGLLCAGFLIYSAQTDATVSSASGTETVTRGCVIRFDGGPHIYDKTNHACNAVQSLSVTSGGDLLLNLVGLPTGTKILYMAAEEDETLSRYVQCGPSGGIGTTLVKCFSRSGNHVTVTGPLMNRPYANLWLVWTYEVPT